MQRMTPEHETVGLEQLAALLMISKERVRQLVKDGCIPKGQRNTYSIIKSVQGYIGFLRDEDRRSSKSAADGSLKAARQREIEMRMAREDNRLIEVEEAIAVTREIVGLARNEFAGLPARVTSDIPLRRKIETEVNASFQRIKDRHTKRASALRRSGEAVDADTED
jgi:hypothetical protein